VTVAPRMALLATGFGTVPLSLVLGSWWPWLAGPIPLAAIVGTFYLAHRWGLLADHRFLALWVGGSAILAVASVVTGLGNGLTDEPNAMPALIGFWCNAVAGCSPASRVDTGLGVLTHANYCVWPAFALVIAGPGFSRSLRARWRR